MILYKEERKLLRVASADSFVWKDIRRRTCRRDTQRTNQMPKVNCPFVIRRIIYNSLNKKGKVLVFFSPFNNRLKVSRHLNKIQI